MVDYHIPRRRAGGDGVGDQSAWRLAARRAESQTAISSRRPLRNCQTLVRRSRRSEAEGRSFEERPSSVVRPEVTESSPSQGRRGFTQSRIRMNFGEPLLAVEHLRVEFPTRRGMLVAVDDVSFSIAPGEVLGVVGESGAGKSLTGSAMIGLIDPPGRIGAGEIWLNGRRIDKLPPEAMRRIRGREIGAIFQASPTSPNPSHTIGRQLVETIL